MTAPTPPRCLPRPAAPTRAQQRQWAHMDRNYVRTGGTLAALARVHRRVRRMLGGAT
jgi:ActR/RegA family two-component response regulator